MYVFSSANAIAKYSIRELIELGVSWIWLGLESPHSTYSKLKGTNTRELVKELQSNGIKRARFDDHRPRAPHARQHRGGNRGTRWRTMPTATSSCSTRRSPARRSTGTSRRRAGCSTWISPTSTGSGSSTSSTRRFARDDSKTLLDWAFDLDYERNGPSLFRLMRTMFDGWKRYRNDPDPLVRARAWLEAKQLRTSYGAALWAMEKYLRDTNRQVSERIRELRVEVERELGIVSRVVNHIAGPVALWASRRDQRLFPEGRRLEPRMFVDRRNWGTAK